MEGNFFDSEALYVTGRGKPCADSCVLTMAFVNPQPLCDIYDSTADAFRRGTLFPSLDKPFLAGGLKR